MTLIGCSVVDTDAQKTSVLPFWPFSGAPKLMTENFGATFIQNPGSSYPFLKNLKFSRFAKNTNDHNNNNNKQQTTTMRNYRVRLRAICPFLCVGDRHVYTIHTNTKKKLDFSISRT